MHTILWPILRRAFAHPRRTAVIDDQRRWRYVDLLGGALHLAERIEKTSGAERIGVMLPTSGAFPMAALAAWLLKRTLVPINYLLAAEHRQHIIDHAELDTVVTVGPMIDYIGERPRGVHLLDLQQQRFDGPPPLRFPPIAAADDPAVALYTSGTSGLPKGVVLTHHNLRSNIDHSIAHVGLTSSDGFLGVLPQFHSFGLTALTLLPLVLGAQVIYTMRFIPRKVLKLSREHRPDVFMAIPSMYNALMTAKDAEADDLTSIRLAISGGEPLPQAVAERFHQRFNVPIREGYGLTETSPIISLNTPIQERPGSVGRPIPRSSVRILDDHRNALPVGEHGEVAVAGPQIMAGYLKQPELTAEVIDDEGYFHTGDWGRIDEDGYLYITGRKKEMLIIGGENVFPREIEEVLDHHPSVRASAVVGRQDAVRGELPVAFVEAEEDATIDEAELRNYCREHLPGYKVPREIHQLDELPRSPTGKILRRELPKLEPTGEQRA